MLYIFLQVFNSKHSVSLSGVRREKERERENKAGKRDTATSRRSTLELAKSPRDDLSKIFPSSNASWECIQIDAGKLYLWKIDKWRGRFALYCLRVDNERITLVRIAVRRRNFTISVSLFMVGHRDKIASSRKEEKRARGAGGEECGGGK